jgi:hypothetical protein
MNHANRMSEGPLLRDVRVTESCRVGSGKRPYGAFIKQTLRDSQRMFTPDAGL